MSGKHDIDHRFDYLFEPLAVDAIEDVPPEPVANTESAGEKAGFAHRRGALTAVLVTIAVLAIGWLLLQPGKAGDGGNTQGNPTPPRAPAATLPAGVVPPAPRPLTITTVEAPVASPAPPHESTANTAPARPSAVAPTSNVRLPPSSPTRAPISVAPETRAPVPYPYPPQDSHRVGSHGIL
ncbi:MAG TPA: hypothetical protein VFB19_10210 [Mycobacterium sp.]|nr:hypothetical protein [Mycobacterium sp.]